MQKYGLCLFVVIMFAMSGITFAKKVEEPAYSTQGWGSVDSQTFDNSQPSKLEKNEQKQEQIRSKKYRNLKKKINKYDSKRIKTQKEIEYLQGRLELSKQKLEAVDPSSKKGEKE